jgi:hypothetical protein
MRCAYLPGWSRIAAPPPGASQSGSLSPFCTVSVAQAIL